MWILLKLQSKPMSMNELGGITCSSLKEECPTYENLMQLVSELHSKGLTNGEVQDNSDKKLSLPGKIAFELNHILDDISDFNKKIDRVALSSLCITFDPEKTNGRVMEPVDLYNFRKGVVSVLELSAKGAISFMFNQLTKIIEN